MKNEIASIHADFGELPVFTCAYGAPSMSPKYAHPRVWVNEDTLPTVIANLTADETGALYEKVQARADITFTGKLKSGVVSQENLRNFGLREVAAIECLAFNYLVTEDELYGYAAIRAAKNFLATVEVYSEKGVRTGSETFEIAKHMSNALGVMGEVYDWCYPLLTEEDRDYIVLGALTRLSSELEVDYPPTAGGCVSGHSASRYMLRDWPTFAVAVADEYPQIYEHILGLLENYYTEAPNWYYPSGTMFQGSAYGYVTHSHMNAELLVERMSGEKLYKGDFSFETIANTFISYIRPDDESLRIGDDFNQNGQTGYGKDTHIMTFGYFLSKSPTLKAWLKYRTNDFSIIDWNSDTMAVTPIKMLLFNDSSVVCTDDDRFTLPLAYNTYAPLSSLIARSAWNDENAWMTFTNIAEAYGANHDHKDAGTFQIYYKGILAPDTSPYEYLLRYGQPSQGYGALVDFAYGKQTISKNGLLVYNPAMKDNGKWLYSGGQKTQGNVNNENATLSEWFARGTADWATTLGRDSSYDADGNLQYAYISGDITNAYDAETVSLVMRSTLSIATEDEEHPLLFIVHDRVVSCDASFKKTFLLHTTNEPTFLSDNVFYYTNENGASGAASAEEALEKYNGKLTVTTLFPAEPSYTVIGGDGKRFFVNGENVGEEGDPAQFPYAEIGWGRVEVSTAGQNADSFLHVMYVGDADRDDAYIPAVAVESATHDGAVSFGCCAMFSRANTPIADEVCFTVTEKIHTCYVNGLQSGTWEIFINGELCGETKVEAESDLAVFSAKAGTVKLLYKN